LIPPAKIAKIERIDNINAAQSCAVIKYIIPVFEIISLVFQFGGN
jgi:hypothetical protein